ncbi:MAG: hypothetical protein PWQ96_1034 [Clostridia bacterium]|nr:putative small acid-soluble spore protein [Clostridiales bacterium]MDK2985392.1 hypothetical protein [Clostridia bacterium]
MELQRSTKSLKKFGKKKKDPLESLKLEVAEELGLLDKVRKYGWSGLSASESGRIGGIMTRTLRERKNNT